MASSDPTAAYGAVVATGSLGLAALSLMWQWRTWRREHGTWLELAVIWRGRVERRAGDPLTGVDLAIRVWNRGPQSVKVTQIALDPNLVRWFDPRISWLFVRPIFGRSIGAAEKRRFVSVLHRGDVPAGAVRYFAVSLRDLVAWNIDGGTKLRGVVWLSNGVIRRSRRRRPVGDASVIPAEWIVPAQA